ncbi:nucleopolyhedrovirus P10 family protein [Streptomyces flavofungini]|uniref:nucleopolyhedrovirus P10 family protein n=1 Tax=Streptomyces flavofungini TaxID=68200 RepID=UPI0025AF6EBA|nr:nucleopolyhedrovirus P10 family protein [Streptomyces flavofungini]WJV49601.1 nucleopolyhedrovirus P10 family protein [Streptomyces flavofungini]
MTGDGWTSAVRRQLGLGRMLPLGGPGDGAWLAESAARSVLRDSAARVVGARVTRLRVSLAEPHAAPLSPDAYVSAVPSPPSALAPGPLRISAEFQAATAEPLATAADRLRAALGSAAAERLGLVVTEVDLRITGLIEGDAAPGDVTPEDPVPARAVSGGTPSADALSAGDDAVAGPAAPRPGRGDEPSADDEERVARAVLAVPGVTRLAGVLGGPARAVHFEEHEAPLTLPRRHVRVELAADARHRTLDVARAVRAAVAKSLPDRPSVAVLVTAVG